MNPERNCMFFYLKRLCKNFSLRTFLIIFITLSILGILFIRGTQYATLSCEEYIEIDPNHYIASVKGYNSPSQFTFELAESDPHVLFDFSSLVQDVRCVEIKFIEPVNLSEVQFFFGRESASFSEGDSLCFPEEYSNVISLLSAQTIQGFRYLRMDIDEDFEIQSVSVSSTYQLNYKYNIYNYLLVLFICLPISAVISCIPATHNLFKYLKNKSELLHQHRIELLRNILITTAISFLCLGIEFLYVHLSDAEHFNVYKSVVWSCFCIIVIFIILYHQKLYQYTHVTFFLVAMILGTATIASVPPVLGITPDDEIHYVSTARMSWGENELISYADNTIFSEYANVIYFEEVYDLELRKQWVEKINKIQEQWPLLQYTSSGINGIEKIAYIPGIIGLILGRSLGLSFVLTFQLGKWFNLLYYSALFACSIKLLQKRGKLLVSLIGLIPSSLFLASSYSYDTWVISFVVLGYSLFIHDLQTKQIISQRKILFISMILVIGMIPKAIYFPLLAPIIFLPKKYYCRANKSRLTVILSMIILMSTFLLPMLINGAGTGDYRGGSEVNSTEQIKFILQNPMQYASILFGFLKEYLSPDNTRDYLTNFFYYGKSSYYTFILIFLSSVCILDNSDNCSKENGLVFKTIMVTSAFVSMILVATALYISFTAVAHNTVLGCQPRYILPILFPLCYTLGAMNVNSSDNTKRKFLIVIIISLSLIYLSGLYGLRISSY